MISGGLVFVSCATEKGEHRGLYAFDRNTGRQVWSKIVDYHGEDLTHPTNPYCGSPPRLTASALWFGTARPASTATIFKGRNCGRADLGTFRHIWGYGLSPVMYHDRVLLNCGPGPRQFVIAPRPVDRQDALAVGRTGRRFRPGRAGQDASKPLWVGSWSTPVLAQVDGHEQVIVLAAAPCQSLRSRQRQGALEVRRLGRPRLYGSAHCRRPRRRHGRISRSGDRFQAGRVGRRDEDESALAQHHTQSATHWFGRDSGRITSTWPTRPVSPMLGIEDRQRSMERPPAKRKDLELDHCGRDRLYATITEGKPAFGPREPISSNCWGPTRSGEPTNSTLAFSNGQAFMRTFEHLFCIEEAPQP